MGKLTEYIAFLNSPFLPAAKYIEQHYSDISIDCNLKKIRKEYLQSIKKENGGK